MEFKREHYLNQLIERKNNSLIKVITGIRRCGKSYLLNVLFYKYLLKQKIKEDKIIKFAFDIDKDIDKLEKYYPNEPTIIYEKRKKIRKINSKKFRAYISEHTSSEGQYYLLLDEIQLLDDFVATLNGFLREPNLDVYVTGSNSYLLSSDIITEFRGRGDQIKIFPLSFKEYYKYYKNDFNSAYKEYAYFGGMPFIFNLKNDKQKSEYLKNLYKEVYINDLLDRHSIIELQSFEKLIDVLASSIGSYTNPTNLEKYYKSELHQYYSHNTIKKHIEYLKDSFLINEVNRYDIKGKKYIKANSKYYFTDLGLRNARMNFRQFEQTHAMENIIYNELLIRGYNVDVGVVEVSERNKNNNYVSKQLEVDFVVNSYNERFYIQSAYSFSDKNKQIQEKKSFLNIDDNFKKIIIVNDNFKPYTSDEGIKIISLEYFLLNVDNLENI